MMEFTLRGISLRVSYLFLAIVVLFVLVDTTGFAVLVVTATAIHELGHLLTMAAMGVLPQSISLQAFGIRIRKKTSLQLSYAREAVIYAMGPVVNLLCAGCFWLAGESMGSMTLRAACVLHLTIAGFNLLPVGVLDGGNILRMLLRRHCPVERARRTERIISFLVLLPVAVVAFYLMLSDAHNYTLLLTCGYLFVLLLFQSGE